ncbi:MAG TPA: flagellar basal body L-ring protein FlgH [Burkholderiaceae bacterium]|nr:flagellar basal body L-ring protein FlgH [Burkholderiaceae bacterium]
MKTRLVVGCLALGAWAMTGIAAAEEPSAPRSLFSDRRAHLQGDVLTVLISEVASVSANAQTRTNKGESASANLLQRDGEMQLANVGIESQSAGGGTIERSGTLLARLTVRIDSVDANGNFLVSGDQLIVLNNEKQHIRLSGVVRADDVAFDNTVPSWRVSGAQIELVGKGILGHRQRPGLLTWLLTLFGE